MCIRDRGKVLTDEEVKERYAKKEPYGEWLDSNLVSLSDLKIPNRKVQMCIRDRRNPSFHPETIQKILTSFPKSELIFFLISGTCLLYTSRCV